MHVTTGLRTRPEETQALVDALRGALAHSLEHDGCEATHLRRDHDDPIRLISFARRASRQDYENYLAWETETGMSDETDELLSEPLYRLLRRHRQSR